MPNRKPPNSSPIKGRTVRGIRSPIPSGYMLARTSSGDGPVEVIPMAQFIASPSFVQSQINKTALLPSQLASVPAHAVLLGEGTGSFGSAGPGTNGQLFVGQTGADPAFKTASGDLTMLATGAGTVTGIQGHPVTNAAPVDGEIFRWSAADAKWDLKAEFASTVIVGSDVYTAMAVSLADPEVVLAGGVPVYVKNAMMANLVKGVTDGSDAAAGLGGEFISAQVARNVGVALTVNTTVTVTSISLTAGDWDVSWMGSVSAATGGSDTSIEGGLSLTAATLTTPPPASGFTATWNGSASAGNVEFPLSGQARVSISATTTIYLVMFGNWSGGAGSGAAYGYLGARRAR